jgi:hypothetical protein
VENAEDNRFFIVDAARVIEAAAVPMSIADITHHFAQGKQIEKRARDGGKTVSLRAAA